MRLDSRHLLLLLALALPAADPFDFFTPTIAVNRSDRDRLDRGEAVARTLGDEPGEVAVFAAVRTKADGARFVAWVRQIAALKQSPFVKQIARFSDPPALEDVRTLTLDDDDVGDIRECRPGDCGLKLSAEEIRRLQAASTSSGSRVAIDEEFRRIVLARAEAYLARGLAALPPDASGDHTDRPEAVFGQLLAHAPFIAAHAPALTAYMAQYPQPAPPHVESFLYWSKEVLGGRPMISITQDAILQPGIADLPEAVVLSKQIFATHYTNGSLSVTAVVPATAAGQHYLLYFNRSQVDVLSRWFGGLARMLINHRIRDESADVLKSLRARLESGPPPG